MRVQLELLNEFDPLIACPKGGLEFFIYSKWELDAADAQGQVCNSKLPFFLPLKYVRIDDFASVIALFGESDWPSMGPDTRLWPWYLVKSVRFSRWLYTTNWWNTH